MFMFYRLRVISFDGGFSHVHALYESTFTRPLIVACDDDRLFPNKFNPFNWFVPNLLDGLA
jgi:hypothetical protein